MTLTARNEAALRYQPLVKMTAAQLRKQIGPRWDHEDLMAYGQIALLRALDSYKRGKGNQQRYLQVKVRYGILDQIRVLDHTRRIYRWRAACQLDDGEGGLMFEPIDAGPAPDETADTARVWQFVEAIPDPRLREIIRLYYAEDLSMREVGHRLGVSEALVSKLHRRAIGIMRAAAGVARGQS